MFENALLLSRGLLTCPHLDDNLLAFSSLMPFDTALALPGPADCDLKCERKTKERGKLVYYKVHTATRLSLLRSRRPTAQARTPLVYNFGALRQELISAAAATSGLAGQRCSSRSLEVSTPGKKE